MSILSEAKYTGAGIANDATADGPTAVVAYGTKQGEMDRVLSTMMAHLAEILSVHYIVQLHRKTPLRSTQSQAECQHAHPFHADRIPASAATAMAVIHGTDRDQKHWIPPRIYLMREGKSDHLDNVLVLDQLDAVDLSLQIRLAVSHLGIRSRKLRANVSAVNTYPS